MKSKHAYISLSSDMLSLTNVKSRWGSNLSSVGQKYYFALVLYIVISVAITTVVPHIIIITYHYYHVVYTRRLLDALSIYYPRVLSHQTTEDLPYIISARC